MLNNIPQKVFLKDCRSVYVTGNAAFAADLGIEVSDIAGGTDYDFFPRELAEKYRKDDAEVMDSRVIKDVEEGYVSGGNFGIIQTVKVPIEDERGEVAGVLGIFWDISERKRAEGDLRNANAELEQFAYVVSHDLRQPLRMINSYLGIIEKKLDSQLDNDLRTYFGFAAGGAKKMDRLM